MPINLRRAWAAPACGLAVVLTLAGCSQSDSSGSDAGGGSGSGSEAASFFNVDDCTDPDAATAKIDGGIKIGYTLPLSGPVAGPVQINQYGFDARIQAFNDAGGLDGQKIEVVKKDDAFAPDKAKANVVDLIQNDDVDALVTFGSGQVGAIADDQNAACVPLLYPSATNPEYFDIESYPWTVQFLPAADRETRYVVQQMTAAMGGTDFTVGIAANETASGQTNAENFTKAAEDAGIEIAATVPDTDPTAAATQLKAANVDVVYHSGLSGTCAGLNVSMDRIGFKPELVMLPSSCALSAEFVAAGAPAEGATLPLYMKEPDQPGADSDEGVQEYLDQMGDVESISDPVTTAGWVQADLLIATIQQAAESEEGLTRASMLTAARSLDYSSPMFLDGVSWKSTPEKLTGVSGFQAGVWSAADQTFVPSGETIQVD
ncbi:ABC transporter substrate-binding protein [Nocardioides flavescens]|uniref:ABC transporter substrate-binding protein n=1 Tax=Nocardioides flavescens TaxID=2691959 RepID=A0A6L7F4D9_9ACTN|nr:ABC transporter substrate-binding protein [Nocardioides flavescens]MXG92085.1 ABC transporter substrate-binding protein [Nocardioides flavescens]